MRKKDDKLTQTKKLTIQVTMKIIVFVLAMETPATLMSVTSTNHTASKTKDVRCGKFVPLCQI